MFLAAVVHVAVEQACSGLQESNDMSVLDVDCGHHFSDYSFHNDI